jgi:hypothetical protein
LEILSWSDDSVTPFYSIPLTINPAAYKISGTLTGTDGVPLTKGKLFLYQKDDNGVVKFINKRELSSSNQFTFNVDIHPYTLYFIPDAASFPDYVPTILGKTVILQPTSFIEFVSNTEINFEILKIQPLPPGVMSISGNVSSGDPSGRIESVAGVPVILLSSSGVPVKLTTTDDNGGYAFANLPEDAYQIVVAFELDQAFMSEPIAVDVTAASAIVNIDMSDGAVEVNTVHQQAIQFTALPAKSFGDAPFFPEVTVSSGLPLTLTSSDISVAEIEDGKIVITGVGQCTITASQDGDKAFLEAIPVERELIVNKGDQQINFAELSEVSIHDDPFALNATSTASLPVSFISENEMVAIIDANNIVTIKGTGSTNITAEQNGNANFNAATPVVRVLKVIVVLGSELDIPAIEVYPNPVTDVINVRSLSPIANITVINTLGEIQNVFLNKDNTISFGGMASGIYFLKIENQRHHRVFKLRKE